MDKVLVFRPLQLGDLLCAVPAFRALRSALPHAEITLMGLPWARSMVKRISHLFDDFIEFPGWPGLSERPAVDPQNILDFLRHVQGRDFHLALQMHGAGGLTNPLVALFKSRRLAGFHIAGEYCPDTQLYIPYPADLPEVWRHLRLLEHLGAPLQGDHLEFPLTLNDQVELEELQHSGFRLAPGTYVCLHPSARAQQTQWPLSECAELAEGLISRGLSVVITGTGKEAPLGDALAARVSSPSLLNLVGRSSLGLWAALLHHARALVCGDAGVSHLAVALGLPSVSLLLQSDRPGWSLNCRRHRVLCRTSGLRARDVESELEDLLSQDSPFGPLPRRSRLRKAASA